MNLVNSISKIVKKSQYLFDLLSSAFVPSMTFIFKLNCSKKSLNRNISNLQSISDEPKLKICLKLTNLAHHLDCRDGWCFLESA